MLAIGAWAGFWSLLTFYPLARFKLLRIDRETEFRGCDLVKHGESAYPAESWVELQYGEEKRKNAVEGGAAGPKNMSGSGSAVSNDAFEMVPTSGKLFKQVFYRMPY